MLYALSFLLLFTIGGLTGLFLGILAVDVHLHDTYFVVAHFHYVMMGSTLIAFLGGLHYWWPKFTGRMYNETARPDLRARRVLRLQPDVLPAVHHGRARHAAPLLGLRPAVPDLPPALDDRRVRPRHLDLHHGRATCSRRSRTARGAAQPVGRAARSSGRRRRRRRSTTSRSRRCSTSSTTTTTSSRSRRIAGSAARRPRVEPSEAPRRCRTPHAAGRPRAASRVDEGRRPRRDRRAEPPTSREVDRGRAGRCRGRRSREATATPTTRTRRTVSTAHDAHGDDHGHGHGSRVHPAPLRRRAAPVRLRQARHLAVPRAGGAVLLGAVRRVHPLPRTTTREIYSYAHKYLDVKMGAINTAVLIFSSLTAAWAVRCAQLNQRKGLILCLVVTIAVRVRVPRASSTSSTRTRSTSTSCSAATSTRASARAATSCSQEQRVPGHQVHRRVGLRRRRRPPKAGWLLRDRRSIRTRTSRGRPGRLRGQGVDGRSSRPRRRGGARRPRSTERDEQRRVARSTKPLPPRKRSSRAEARLQRQDHGRCSREVPVLDGAGRISPAVCRGRSPSAARRRTGSRRSLHAGRHPRRVRRPRGARRRHPRSRPSARRRRKPADAGDLLADEPTSRALGKTAIQPAPRAHRRTRSTSSKRGPAARAHEHVLHDLLRDDRPARHPRAVRHRRVHLAAIRAIKGHFTPDYFGPVDYAALYWHIVDLIWIFLFPLLYLIH